MSLELALAALRQANRVDGTRASYRKDNPAEYQKVIDYLDGGTRPIGADEFSFMGRGLVWVEDSRRLAQPPPPPPPPPSGAKLRWAPPATTTSSDKVWPRERRTSAIGEIKGYRNVVAVGGEITGGTTGSQGHIVPRENSGTFHWEGWRLALTTNADAFTARWKTPTIQIQACFVEVTKAGTTAHADGFQTQVAIIDELRFDRCTFKTDYQGIFESNEPSPLPPDGTKSRVTKTVMSRVLFLKGAQGLPQTFFFKAFPPRPGCDPIGLTEMYDVWMPNESPLYKVYPNGYNWKAWDGSNNKYGCFLESKMHANGTIYPFIRFSTAADRVPAAMPLAGQQCGDCQVRGDGGIWLGTPPAALNVGAPADAGFNYQSPGYL